MMNYTATPASHPIRNGKRPIAHMSIANEIEKVRSLVDITILAVENARRSLSQIDHLSDPNSTDVNEAESRLERSLKILRQRRNDLGSYL
jgi:hypothetical protein